MSIEINGLEVALGRLDLFTDIGKIETAVTKATLLLEREAVKKCQKGEIQQSIQHSVDGVKGTVFTPHRLAPYMEFGTGIYSIHPKGGRKEVPWVYVEGQYNEPASKRIYTEAEADRTVASMRAEGIPAVKTYGSEPMPFLRPALDENRQEILRILGDSLLND